MTMLISAAVNQLLARFEECHATSLSPYAHDNDLFQETVHLRDVLRINKYHIIGEHMVLNEPPAWCTALLAPPFNNAVYGRWLAILALDHLDLMGQADNIFWSAFEAQQVQISAIMQDDTMQLYFWLPLDTLLDMETRFFMQNFIDMLMPNRYNWPEEREFDLMDGMHDLVWKRQAVSRDPRVVLTELQCSTVEWLRSRLDEEGTLLPLFMTYTQIGRRFHYSHELGVLTCQNLRHWSRRCVVLADNMAGKDTAVAVYLRERPQTRSVSAVIFCADEVAHAQWCVKLSGQQVQTYIVTYAEVQQETFVMPKAPLVIFDSAVVFRAIILQCIDLMQFNRIIFLASYAPNIESVWQFLMPSRKELVETIWLRTLLDNCYLADLWSACVLTHEEALCDNFVWRMANIPLEQPRLYKKWKTETLAYYTSLLDADTLNATSALHKAIRRMQLGMLGYVDAPEVHYSVVQDMVACSICLEARASIPVRTACGHTFCSLCIRQWLQRTRTCPLCRATSTPLTMTTQQVNMSVIRRVPFVQKQLKIREVLLSYNKIIVISRHNAILETLARTWAPHPTFYATAEFMRFNRATRGIWFSPLNVLYRNYEVDAPVDLVLCLEPYSLTHAVVYSVYRLFSFVPTKPVLMMLQSDADVDAIMPEENAISHMWGILQA